MSTPREIDEQLATMFDAIAEARQAEASEQATIMRMAGARKTYSRYDGGWSLSWADAVKALDADPDFHNLSYGRTNREALARFSHVSDKVLHLRNEADAFEREHYTGWSRFFVVTSSAGHIHSSQYCSTCRDTTRFGWLPHLSGKSEAEAIEFFGPAAECLCTVCFPDAPVAKDRNLTTHERDAILNGETPMSPAERKAAKEAEKKAKADAKLLKAAQRAEKLLAKVDKAYADLGGQDKVLALDSVYNLVHFGGAKLQTTVANVILDDHREHQTGRRAYDNPRDIINQAREAGLI